MPKVSIIVPNYNHAKYLRQRIDSILNQTYQDFEVIILDDCSTDSSKEIIEKYRGHSKVSHIVYNDENSGSTFKQWHKGINLAEGKFIWLAESDDWAEKNFLEETVIFLQKFDNVGLVFTSFFRTNSEGVILYSNKTDYEGKIEPYKNYDGKHLIKNQFILGNAIPNTSSVVFRKNRYEDVDKEQLFSFKYIGDWFLWVNILANSNFVYIDKELDYFRGHLENVSNNAEKEGLDYLESNQIYQFLYSQKLISKDEKRLIRVYCANVLINILVHKIRGLNFNIFLKIAYEFLQFDKLIVFAVFESFILRTFKKITHSLLKT